MSSRWNPNRLFFALWAISSPKRAAMLSRCLDSAIQRALEAPDYEMAAAFRDLRDQLIPRESAAANEPLPSFETAVYFGD